MTSRISFIIYQDQVPRRTRHWSSCALQRRKKLSSKIGFSMLLILLPLAHAGADEPDAFKNSPEYQEIWRKSQSLRPQPSIDTTPVIIKIASNTYRIPRNYISYMPIPTIKVTIPDLKPLTNETRPCFGSILQGQKVHCGSIEFRLFGPGLYTPREMFDNQLGVPSSISPEKGPFGYDVYKRGPQQEIYTKDDGEHFIEVDCHIFDNQGKKAAVCDNTFVLDDGNTMRFFSNFDQLSSIPEIEANIRQLMNDFKVN